MNEVRISGKVRNIYVYKDVLNIFVGCFYKHGESYADSMFRIFVTKPELKDRYSFLSKGDKITVEAHLHFDLGMTSGGNRKDLLRIYADNIKVDSIKGEQL